MESLRCDLFEPGMTPFHRAGIGGLVSTLQWIDNNLSELERPPGQWTIDERSVTLKWDESLGVEPFFDQLFSLAYQIREGLIYLPGQHGQNPPPLEVRAALQEGLLLSLYDHGPKSRGGGPAVEKTYEVDGLTVSYRYLPLLWYKHQRDGSKLMVKGLQRGVGLTRMLFPGAVQRHAAYKNSQITQSTQLLLALLFAPIGVFALRAGGKRVNIRGKRRFKPGAALLIPNINSLSNVQYILPGLCPRTIRDCQIDNLADAALQAELRLRSKNLLVDESISSLRCVWCCPNDWSSRLQPPSTLIEVSAEKIDIALDQFEIAMRCFAPKRRKNRRDGRVFWTKSHVRPLVADNLIAGLPWYRGFMRLMTAIDVSGNKPKPIRDSLEYERGGLNTMMQENVWNNPGETTVVLAVHEAMRCRYGRIAAENSGKPAAMKNRMRREYERQRLAFVGAKTADALRHALADLWSRAGSNKVLRENWRQVIPMLSNERWQLARDLSLIALASYKGKEQEDINLAESD